MIPALFPASSSDDSPGDITTSHQPPSQEGGGTASAATVTITLGDQEDTKVRIQAEMDAGFLGEGRTDEEVIKIETVNLPKLTTQKYVCDGIKTARL